jgi:TRAP-type C4-dicarboxylate transport system permease small subunit
VIKKFWGKVAKVAEISSVLGFAALFSVFILQVFFRYVLGDPLSWTQEVAGILYVWIVCVTSAAVLKINEHVSFDLVYEAVSPSTRRILAGLGAALVLIVLLATLYGNFDYIAFTSRQTTPTLRLPMSYVFSAFGVFLVLVILNAGIRIYRLLGRDWTEEL